MRLFELGGKGRAELGCPLFQGLPDRQNIQAKITTNPYFIITSFDVIFALFYLSN